MRIFAGEIRLPWHGQVNGTGQVCLRNKTDVAIAAVSRSQNHNQIVNSQTPTATTLALRMLSFLLLLALSVAAVPRPGHAQTTVPCTGVINPTNFTTIRFDPGTTSGTQSCTFADNDFAPIGNDPGSMFVQLDPFNRPSGGIPMNVLARVQTASGADSNDASDFTTCSLGPPLSGIRCQAFAQSGMPYGNVTLTIAHEQITGQRITMTIALDGSVLGSMTPAESPASFVTITPLAPEINVTGNGQDIADDANHDPTAVTDDTDFGSTNVGTPVVRTFTIENTGPGTLTLNANSVSITGTNAGDFTVNQQPPATIPANQTADFQITFNPTDGGLRGPADVEINNDDGDESPYNFRIQGTGIAPTPEIDVSGNGQGIADDLAHDPTAVADGTDFGNADVNGVPVVRTFTISNTDGGILILGPNAVSISGANGGDFTVSQQPPDMIGANQTADFQITFSPTAAGLRGPADVEINNNDTDETPYNFRIQGTGIITTGTITIVKSTAPAAAGDGTFTFSSSDPGLNGLSITTSSNIGQGAATLVNAGAITVTENAITGWKLASITCVGDNDNGSIFDVANRNVVIDLDGGEAIVCTFTNRRDENFVVTRTQRVISNFVSRRADQITAGDPDLVSRLNGGSIGNTGIPFNLTGAGTFDRAQLNFSTSLSQIVGAREAEKRKWRQQLTGSLGFGGKGKAETWKGMVAQEESKPKFDIWVEGKGLHVDDETRESDIGLLYLGADYRINPGFLVGLLAQVDWVDESDSVANTAADGVGWMVGPYAVARLHDNLYFDGRLAAGQSDNNVNPLGLYTDGFDATRWLARGRLTGSFNRGAWQLSPHVGVHYFEEEQKAYVDSLGNAIPGQTISLGRMTFGPKIGFRHETEGGTVIAPHVSLHGIWDFDEAEIVNLATGLAAGSEELRGRVEGGVAISLASGLSLTGKGFFDGVGSEDLAAYGGSLRLEASLN